MVSIFFFQLIRRAKKIEWREASFIGGETKGEGTQGGSSGRKKASFIGGETKGEGTQGGSSGGKKASIMAGETKGEGTQGGSSGGKKASFIGGETKGEGTQGGSSGGKRASFIGGVGDAKKADVDKKGSRETLSTQFVTELCTAFCRDSGSEDKSAAAEKFRHVLITNANDEAVRIQSMRVGTHIAVCLSKVLKGHPLSTLDLYNNCIRDVGAIALLQLIRVQPTIRHLNIGCNDLSHESGIAYARELGTIRLLTLELGADGSPLYGNRFNNKVGVAIGEGLAQSSTLTSLGLNGTGLGRKSDKAADIDTAQEASQSLRRGLSINTTLQVRPVYLSS